MKFPGVVAVLCVVPSGLVLHIGITSCTFPPWAEMSKKNRYEGGLKKFRHVLLLTYPNVNTFEQTDMGDRSHFPIIIELN